MLCFLVATYRKTLRLIWVRKEALQQLTDIADAFWCLLHVRLVGLSRLLELLHTPRQQLDCRRRPCSSRLYPSQPQGNSCNWPAWHATLARQIGLTSVPPSHEAAAAKLRNSV